MVDKARSNEELMTKNRASILGIEYFDTSQLQNRPLFRGILSNEDMYKIKGVVINKVGNGIVIGITSNTPQHSIDDVKKRFQDINISYVMISTSGFEEYMLLYDPPIETVYEDIELAPEGEKEKAEEISSTLNQVKADDMLDYILRQAWILKASDIHLENSEDDVRIRFRVDGVLHEIANLTKDKYRQLMHSIAIAGNVSTDSPKAQTGHIDYKITDEAEVPENQKKPDVRINLRIETVPANNGQDVVMRLFHMDKSLLQLTNLGLNSQQSALVDDVVEHPTGLVMSVGPTGSGKTTTLYSVLNALNIPTRKIITLEDPVEFTMDGVDTRQPWPQCPQIVLVEAV